MSVGYGYNSGQISRIPRATACGVDDEFFHVRCPGCNELVLTSRETRDGDLCDCDCWPRCLVSYFFYAGDYAAARLP